MATMTERSDWARSDGEWGRTYVGRGCGGLLDRPKPRGTWPGRTLGSAQATWNVAMVESWVGQGHMGRCCGGLMGRARPRGTWLGWSLVSGKATWDVAWMDRCVGIRPLPRGSPGLMGPTRPRRTWLSWTYALKRGTSGRLPVQLGVQEDLPWPCRAYMTSYYFLVGSS
jgi:hypothetical protein